MSLEVFLRKGPFAAEEVSFFSGLNKAWLYYSEPYRNLLEQYAGCQTICFFLKDEKGNILGAFPLAVSMGKYGKVANSLPYYGSNGSVIFDKNNTAGYMVEEIISRLTEEVIAWIEKEGCVASNFVTHPFYPEVSDWFSGNLKFDFKDERIGQITPLPVEISNDEALVSLFDDPRPRNIRRALKAGIKVRKSHDEADMEFLFRVHKENIESIGGKAKDYRFFESVSKLIPREMYGVWVAETEGKPIAALLLFYFNQTIEYFTPATLHEYRNLQPSSLLIFEAMKEGVKSGFTFWNWGGTWKTQTGVYDFKKKWGAQDFPYEYYCRIYDKSLLNLTATELGDAYPHFYVLPFSALTQSHEEK